MENPADGALQNAFQAIIETKLGETKARWIRASAGEPFGLIRNRAIALG
jgi:hypothetical protein